MPPQKASIATTEQAQDDKQCSSDIESPLDDEAGPVPKRRKLNDQNTSSHLPQHGQSASGDTVSRDTPTRHEMYLRGRQIVASHIAELQDAATDDEEDAPSPIVSAQQPRDDEDEVIDPSKDDEGEHSDTDNGVHDTPDGVLLAEARNDNDDRFDTIQPRYGDFLSCLCTDTGTCTVEPFVINGLKIMVRTLRSLALDTSHVLQQDTDIYAHALVIWTWLAACQKSQIASFPTKQNLAKKMSVYYLSSFTLLSCTYAFKLQKLDAGVRYWERRPMSKWQSNWEKQAWLANIPDPEIVMHQKRNRDADEYMQALWDQGKTGLIHKILEKDLSSISTS